MMRPLSALIALVLALGSVPAQAQVALGRISLQTGVSAPVPAGGALAAPSSALAPVPSALSLAVSPAAFAPVPIQPASVIPAVSVAPLPAPARAETPLAILRVVAAPEFAPLAGAAFDGSLSAPVLWDAAPAMKFGYAIGFAGFLALKTVVPLTIAGVIWRKLRGTPSTAAKPPPGRRAKVTVALAGAMLGMFFASVPYRSTGPAVEKVEMVRDMFRAPAAREQVRWITGGSVQDEAIKELSKNQVGREVLDGLRDRGGVIRLPTFFVSNQASALASHVKFFDGVYLDDGHITKRGWTVEQFLGDPALQRRLIREEGWLIVHELTHGVQARRPFWTAGYFKSPVEIEQEAFLRQTQFLLVQLEADPTLKNDSPYAAMLERSADDFDGFLEAVAALYPDNAPTGDPYVKAFLAEQRALWPEYRVRVYKVLAARAQTPESAKMYLDKAAAAAAR